MGTKFIFSILLIIFFLIGCSPSKFSDGNYYSLNYSCNVKENLCIVEISDDTATTLECKNFNLQIDCYQYLRDTIEKEYGIKREDCDRKIEYANEVMGIREDLDCQQNRFELRKGGI